MSFLKIKLAPDKHIPKNIWKNAIITLNFILYESPNSRLSPHAGSIPNGYTH